MGVGSRYLNMRAFVLLLPRLFEVAQPELNVANDSIVSRCSTSPCATYDDPGEYQPMIYAALQGGGERGRADRQPAATDNVVPMRTQRRRRAR
jgi:hypothetical protein